MCVRNIPDELEEGKWYRVEFSDHFVQGWFEGNFLGVKHYDPDKGTFTALLFSTGEIGPDMGQFTIHAVDDVIPRCHCGHPNRMHIVHDVTSSPILYGCTDCECIVMEGASHIGQ